MKIKRNNSNDNHFVHGKITGTLADWHLTFGKYKNTPSDEIDKGYLRWMQENMSLSKPEELLLESILSGEKPKKVSGQPKKPRKPVVPIDELSKLQIKIREIETRPQQPHTLNSKDEARIGKLEKTIPTIYSMLLELRELYFVHNEEIFPKENNPEHKKVIKALDKFEASLNKKKPKRKNAKKKNN